MQFAVIEPDRFSEGLAIAGKCYCRERRFGRVRVKRKSAERRIEIGKGRATLVFGTLIKTVPESHRHQVAHGLRFQDHRNWPGFKHRGILGPGAFIDSAAGGRHDITLSNGYALVLGPSAAVSAGGGDMVVAAMITLVGKSPRAIAVSGKHFCMREQACQVNPRCHTRATGLRCPGTHGFDFDGVGFGIEGIFQAWENVTQCRHDFLVVGHMPTAGKHLFDAAFD